MTVLPVPPRSFSRGDLEDAGFTGWRTWTDLRATDLREVPAAPAAYIVWSPSLEPAFTEHNPGGRFKGKDPSVSREILEASWVVGTSVIYIGKADDARRRLRQFARFGAGEPVGHWGGRFIWQVRGAAELRIAWHQVRWDQTAREYEKRLLSRFAELHGGARPFANLSS